MSARTCIGVDVGGTFTDAVLTDGTTTWRAKAPTTPGRVGRAGCSPPPAWSPGAPGGHLEALLPTVEPLRPRHHRGDQHAGRPHRPAGGSDHHRAASRRCSASPGARASSTRTGGWRCRHKSSLAGSIAAVHERIDRDGRIVVPLDTAEVVEAVRRLVDDERRRGGGRVLPVVVRQPGARGPARCRRSPSPYPASPSCPAPALHPAIREYERTTFAVLNAYVSGALGGIEELETDLRALGLAVPLLLVHSGGGSITVAEARRQPLGLAASGPAAGVAASVVVGGASGASPTSSPATWAAPRSTCRWSSGGRAGAADPGRA